MRSQNMGFMLRMTLSIIWLGANYFFSSHGGGKGGVVILVSPKFVDVVVELTPHKDLFVLCLIYMTISLGFPIYMPLIILEKRNPSGTRNLMSFLTHHGFSMDIFNMV
jgi:hypothetical protein